MSNKKTAPLWILIIVCALGVSAVAAYVKSTPRIAHKDETAPPPVVTPKRDAQPAATENDSPKSVSITVFKPTMGANGIVFAEATESVPAGEEPRLYAVNRFLVVGKIVPSDAKALGVEVIDGIAHVNFNPAFDHTYGSFDEKSLLDGFAATFGQFDDVNSVQLEIAGKPIDTLGNVDLKIPIPVIRPKDVPTTPVAVDHPKAGPSPSAPDATPQKP